MREQSQVNLEINDCYLGNRQRVSSLDFERINEAQCRLSADKGHQKAVNEARYRIWEYR
jgi:hypothetical protein